MLYLDSSALVKRYVEEKGSDLVNHLVSRHTPAGISWLSYVEVHAAFARRWREGHLDAADYKAVARRFEADIQGFGRIDVRVDIIVAAKELAIARGLKTLDSIHLASALRFSKGLVPAQPLFFAAADRQLLTAAAAEGLRAINVEHSK